MCRKIQHDEKFYKVLSFLCCLSLSALLLPRPHIDLRHATTRVHAMPCRAASAPEGTVTDVHADATPLRLREPRRKKPDASTGFHHFHRLMADAAACLIGG